MLQARDFFYQEIWWESREGDASVLFDDLTQLERCTMSYISIGFMLNKIFNCTIHEDGIIR